MKLSMSIHPSPWGAGILARQPSKLESLESPSLAFLGRSSLLAVRSCQNLLTLACWSKRINHEQGQRARTRVKCPEGHWSSFFVLLNADCGVLIAELRRESFKWPSR